MNDMAKNYSTQVERARAWIKQSPIDAAHDVEARGLYEAARLQLALISDRRKYRPHEDRLWSGITLGAMVEALREVNA